MIRLSLQSAGPYATLRQLVKTHAQIVQDVVRVQNRIRALFRSRGVVVPSKTVYSRSEHSVLSFLRKGSDPGECVAIVFNFTPVPRTNYRIGVENTGFWQEIVNTDGKEFGGSGYGNLAVSRRRRFPLTVVHAR